MSASCGGGGSEDSDDCVSNEQFFKEEVFGPTLQAKCMACHTTQGQAKDSSFILQDSNWGPDYIEQNMKVFEQLSKLQFEGEPWILLKPTNTIAHEGASQFDEGSEEYKSFEEMITRLENPVSCDEGDVVEEFFDGVELLDEVATLRKASLTLVGRLPTLEEEQQVRDGGFEALDSVLDAMMTEEAFFDRVIEIYNDYLLTDRYYPGTEAIGLLAGLQYEDDGNGGDGTPVYPNIMWYEDIGNEEERALAEDFTNKGLARESLELIAHVVKNDLPYTEVLTADYTMVNPFSAQAYGVSPNFETGEYDEFVPAKIPGIPHAGVLTNSVFMNRFPTTPTNRNRHRSRKIYEFFLATDVQRLGERPVDATKIEGFNPTMNDPNCAVCHAIIDPVAGTMQNFTDDGFYAIPTTGWFPDMRQPGYGDIPLPPGDTDRAVAWMAEQVTQDSRFAIAPIHILFKGLAGQNPLREPTDPKEAGYLEGVRAFSVQQQIFQGIADGFVESGYNLKSVIKGIIKSPYYRAANAFELDESRALELKDVGTGRLLTPEQLHRKVEAVTGQPWRNGSQGDDYLLSENQYKIFYGGIDSNDVVVRITEPNGIMANVAGRMSNEISCWTTAADFSREPSERMLFPYVDPSFEPEDANGFEVAGSAQAIRANIQYLHERLLGEYLSINDPEIDRTYKLFLQVWKGGNEAMGLDQEDPEYIGPALAGTCQATQDWWTGEPLPEGEQVTNDPNYAIRSWMAVMSYLLRDYRFLHE